MSLGSGKTTTLPSLLIFSIGDFSHFFLFRITKAQLDRLNETKFERRNFYEFNFARRKFYEIYFFSSYTRIDRVVSRWGCALRMSTTYGLRTYTEVVRRGTRIPLCQVDRIRACDLAAMYRNRDRGSRMLATTHVLRFFPYNGARRTSPTSGITSRFSY